VIGRRLGESTFCHGTIGHIAGHSEAVDVGRHFGGGLLVDVENRHLGAGLGQHARGGGAEPRGASGHDRGMSSNVHDQLIRLVGFLGVFLEVIGRRR
jgi:hypothetical protein